MGSIPTSAATTLVLGVGLVYLVGWYGSPKIRMAFSRNPPRVWQRVLIVIAYVLTAAAVITAVARGWAWLPLCLIGPALFVVTWWSWRRAAPARRKPTVGVR